MEEPVNKGIDWIQRIKDVLVGRDADNEAGQGTTAEHRHVLATSAAYWPWMESGIDWATAKKPEYPLNYVTRLGDP